VITVYQGDNCRPQFCVAQNDYSSGRCSTVEFAASPFVTYWIFVDGYFGTYNKGNFRLTVGTSPSEFTPTPSPNEITPTRPPSEFTPNPSPNESTPSPSPILDECVEGATIDPQIEIVFISGSTTNIETADIFRSTTSPNSCLLYSGFGIWYKINPFNNNANLIASTCNEVTTFNTVITVFRGGNCRPRFCVAQNDDSDSAQCSLVMFGVSPFATYWIFVESNANDGRGDFLLTVDVEV
jgi:hypothetical protein